MSYAKFVAGQCVNVEINLTLSIFVALFVVPLSARSQVTEAGGNLIEEQTPTYIVDLHRIESRVKVAIENVLPAVVAVGNRFGRDSAQVSWEGRRFASGVLIREDGLILSQYHVSHEGIYNDATGLIAYGQPGDKVDVVLHDGRRMEAELLGGERLADVSLLKLIEPGPYPFVTFAQDDPAVLGDWGIKLGHPCGYQSARGAISRLGRVVYTNPANFVTDCLTAGGDSGGPFINLDGRIVGIVQNSFMPRSVAEVANDRGVSMSYMTSQKIQQKMGSMLAGVVPHETTFDDLDERKRQYGEVQTILPTRDGRSGATVCAGWISVANETGNSVVEVLDAGRKRAVYGTVVGTDGWIITKASAVVEYPFCRMPNGQIVAARTIGVDISLDLALLKANANDLEPVRWSRNGTHVPGTFVMAMGIDSSSIAVGIVSAAVHTDGVCFENGNFVSGIYSKVFEHDMSLQEDEYGGPVFNLAGDAIGITIADAGPHGCLNIPTQAIVECIQRLKN